MQTWRGCSPLGSAGWVAGAADAEGWSAKYRTSIDLPLGSVTRLTYGSCVFSPRSTLRLPARRIGRVARPLNTQIVEFRGFSGAVARLCCVALAVVMRAKLRMPVR